MEDTWLITLLIVIIMMIIKIRRIAITIITEQYSCAVRSSFCETLLFTLNRKSNYQFNYVCLSVRLFSFKNSSLTKCIPVKFYIRDFLRKYGRTRETEEIVDGNKHNTR
jgi:hypothetical protein